MYNIPDNHSITPESALAVVTEMLARSGAEFDRKMAESRADYDRKMAESRAEADKRAAEADKKAAERAADFDREMKESREKFDCEIAASRADWERRSAELNQQIKEIGKQVGGWGNSHGAFAEDYFFNSFSQGKCNFFGEKFDEIKKNLKGLKTDDEFDVVMFNGSCVCILEVKFRGRLNKTAKLIKKAKAFRDNFSEYATHKVYLALATLVSDEGVENECFEHGIAVVKQSGDNVVIHDERMKAY